MKTVHFAGPVILRTREEDPQGMPPIDSFGQPAKNRDGSPAKPFKIVEKHFHAGPNLLEDADAAHPYIVAHALSAPRAASADFTIEQLETLLAEKRAAILAGKKPDAKKGGDEKDDLPYPDDAAIDAMSPKELRGLINASGGSDRGVKDVDLPAMAKSLRPSK